MNHLFIVGAQRSGSTYLYNLLDDHPEISMAKPVRPEPKFFLNDELYSQGREFYEKHHFTSVRGRTRYLGEKSTAYIESLVAARRIRDFYPEAIILIILRDPVQRAWSNYRFSRQHKLETLEFEDALAAEPDRLTFASYSTSVNPYAYVRRGHYMDYIDGYLTVFSAQKVNILIFEESVGNLAAIQNVYRLLGIDHSFIPPSLGKTINPGEVEHTYPKAVLRGLATSYAKSVTRLEAHLGRPIYAWRNAWDAL